MDLATATNSGEVIDLAGEEFHVRQLTLKEWGQLTTWLKRANPSPLERAARAIDAAIAGGEPLSPAAAEQLLHHAQLEALNWPPRLGSDDWFQTLDRVEGGYAQVVYHCLVKTDPGFTLAQAEVLAGRFGVEDFRELLRVALWGTPRRHVPKATAAGEAASRTTEPTTGPG